MNQIVAENGDTKIKAPNRWLYCPKFGQVIEGKFLPFKTPLSDEYDVPDEAKFYPQEIFDTNLNGVKEGSKVKLWINLAITDKRYGKEAVTSNDCMFQHMPIPGFEEPPTEEDVETFFGIVDNFVEDHPDDIVAVHCTHGFNRTGFLISAYLVKRMGFDVATAVKKFSEARPQGIYKEDYLREFFQRFDPSFNPAEELPFQCPPRPDWELLTDEMSKLGFAEPSNQKPQFMNGRIRTVNHIDDPELAETLNKELLSLLQPFSQKDLQGSKYLPSSQTVPLEKKNIDFLSTKPYIVSWKADTVRYMIYIKAENEVYAFDRDMNIFQLPLKFPRKEDLTKHISGTVMDADILVEKVIVNGRTYNNTKMFIFDLMCLEGEPIGSESYQIRRDAIHSCITSPRSQARTQGLMATREPIYVYQKDFRNIVESKKLLSPEFAKSLPCKINGLIFQAINEPYICGRNSNLLKWTDSDNTTIDFRLKVAGEKNAEDGTIRYYSELYTTGKERVFRKMNAPTYVQELDGRIIECYLKDNKFSFKRERKDKSFANSYETAKAIAKSLEDPVTKEFLMEYIKENGMIEKEGDQPQMAE